MASAAQNLSSHDPEVIPSGKGKSFGIIVSEWNSDITKQLLKGCADTLEQYGVSPDDIHTQFVPGSFELPLGAKLLAQKRGLHAIICLGCVIKGETKHDEYINHAVASGIMQLGLELSTPVIFGVLTPNDQQQAIDRAGGKHGNKGVEAAITALKMAAF